MAQTMLTTTPRVSATRTKNFAEGERPSRAASAIVWVIMAACLLYFLVPVLWLLIASTKSTSDLFSTPGFSFARFHFFDNVASVSTYDGGIFWRWMLNSLIYSGLGSVLTAFISMLCGYALAIYSFRGRSAVMGAVLASLLVPATVLAQPTYVLLVQLGLSNNYLGVILPALVYPFGVMLSFITAKSSIPMEILEAARLDGAGELRVFFTIGMRLMSTGMVTVILFAFIGSWNNFLLPLLVLNNQDFYPVTLGLNGWERQSVSVAGLQGLTIIGAFLSIIPIVIVFISLQRFWRSGLAAGGVRF
jgi:multiple sugar transport system permease protein